MKRVERAAGGEAGTGGQGSLAMRDVGKGVFLGLGKTDSLSTPSPSESRIRDERLGNAVDQLRGVRLECGRMLAI